MSAVPSSPPRPATITRQFAGHIANARPGESSQAMQAAREGVLDFLAVAFAGAGDPGLARLRAVLAPAATRQASVIGADVCLNVLDVALLNAYAGHVLDYDDQHGTARGHPSTVLLPALFALGESSGSAFSQLLQAYVVGVETMARLGLALGGWHYEHGFHQTATLGVIGAAAAAAHLLAFDVDAIENTLGLAVTQAAGLRFQFGSEGKPLHAGLAARAGLFAAQLSQGGVQGAPGCLDGPLGFFSVFGGDTAVPERAVQSWGRPWQIVTPGLHFKPYPCCIGSHYAAEAALALRERHALQPGDIAAIRVTFPKGGDIPLQVRRPASGLEGRFSVEYVVAVALTEGALALAAFSDRPVRADLDGLARRVSRHYDLDGPPAAVDPTARYSVVEIELKNGAIVSQKIDRLSAAADLSTKFMDAVGGDQALRDLPQLVHTMQSAADLARLTAFFPRTGGAAEGVGGSA